MKSSKLLIAFIALCLLTGLIACGSSGGSAPAKTAPATTTPAPAAPAATIPPAAPALVKEVGGGVIEGAKKIEMVDNVVVVMTSATFDPAPFGSVGGRGAFEQMLFAAPLFRNHFTQPWDDKSSWWMAKNITKVNDSTYDIEFWDNIKDSQGNLITVDDVIWSYEMLVSIGEQISVGNNIKKMSNMGNNIMRLEQVGPGAMVTEQILGYNRVGLCNRAWYEKTSPDERATNPATTGPYKIKSVVPGAEIVLEAVEPYWMPEELRPAGMKQTVKTITMRTIAEPAMRSIALENKEVDVAAIAASEYTRFYENGKPKPGYNVRITDSDHAYGFYLNMDKKSGSVTANNPALRKAILTMLKWDDIMMSYGNTFDTAMPCFTTGVTNTGGFNPEWTKKEYWPYSVELGKKYLEEAGFKPGEVTIRFLTRVGATADATNSVIVAHLGAIGINVDIISYDQATFNNFKFDSSHWDMILDNKPSAHLATGWDDSFNPKGYSNGGMNFLFAEGNDTKEGIALLDAALNKTSPQTIEAFHQFLIDQAACKSVFVALGFRVSQDGILDITCGQGGQLMPSGFVFAENYKSALGK